MIKMRIEFYKDKELEDAIKFLETQYQIIDRAKLQIQKEFNKMRLIHLELVKNKNVPVTGTNGGKYERNRNRKS
ncbi:MAG: hypothetical protein ACLRHW_13205 [Coprobacillus cateniformis]